MSLPIIIATVVGFVLVLGLAVISWRLRLFKKAYWRRGFVVACLLLLGILVGFLPLKPLDSSQLTTDSDIIFMVDTTYSMNALDGRDGDTRLADAQKDIQTYAKQLGGSRIGMVVFDRSSTIYLPLTSTYSDVETATSTLSTSAYYLATGSPSFAGALENVKSYVEKLQDADNTRHRVVVLMTDGELTGDTDTPENVNNAARQLAREVDAAVVIGYGTNGGAKMPVISPDFGEGSDGALKREDENTFGYQNDKFVEVVSKRDESQLRAMAQSLGGAYVPAQDTAAAEAAIVEARKQAADKQAKSSESRALRQNLLHVPMAILILGWLLLTEIWGFKPIREWMAGVGGRR